MFISHQSSELTIIRGFAANIGVDFKTPEEFFLNQAPEALEKPFDPASYLHTGEQDPPLFSRQHPLELVIFCGSPGAGKSTFYWNNLEPLGYERVNQDILKTVRLESTNEHKRHKLTRAAP